MFENEARENPPTKYNRLKLHATKIFLTFAILKYLAKQPKHFTYFSKIVATISKALTSNPLKTSILKWTDLSLKNPGLVPKVKCLKTKDCDGPKLTETDAQFAMLVSI